MANTLPVTLLSGLPDAGKTTLLRHLRSHCGDRRIALIVNDLHSLDIEGSVPDDVRACLSAEAMRAAAAHFATAGFDALVIESSGFSEPTGMVETFGAGPGEGTRFDTMATVIDAWTFYRDYFSRDTVAQRLVSQGADAAGDQRSVIDVLLDQVEFADVIVLNKCDLVNDQQRGILLGMLRALNPRAELVEATHGRVAPTRLLGTDRYDVDATARAAGWMQLMRGTPVPESPAFGIRSFTWQARRPLHPLRFSQLIHEKWRGVLRSKGYFWLASRNSHVGEWEQGGAISRLRSGGHWWCFTRQEEWPTAAGHLALIHSRWDADWGDRRQDLVFIGMGMDEAALKSRFDACLLTDDEMAFGEAAWINLTDPLPAWHDDHDHNHHGDHPDDAAGPGHH
ncbi:MAG: GTP-binding protein [Methyloversatilis sp.]|jgi:G3E family GTPase|nr:GTP-binding protein [Methyloversatilis sp.]MBP6193381.1 GTP-binding protein [Methyloversatilis sp.]MBP9117835.1 GTP-binding protein [Methyloversatilis sp.]